MVNDSGIRVVGTEGASWLGFWWVLVALQMTYGKTLTDKITMSQWERVFYNNIFAIPPTFVLYYATGENQRQILSKKYAFPYLMLSCIVGVAISYSGWKCRSLVTATTFTLVGVMNKMVTIIFAIVLWPDDSSGIQTIALLACVGFGLLYEDAPMRTKNKQDTASHVETATQSTSGSK